MTETFCAAGAAAEPLAGTAPHRPVWALIEHPGPWGREAVLDAPWPADDLGARLAALTDAAGVRVVLARRPGAGERGAPRRPAVVLARYGTDAWTATTTLDAPADLLGLDWAGLAAAPAAPVGWTDPGPVWGICTHGTRDACCARLGRPLAQAFAALEPAGSWEISHSGGHRFAGVAVDLAAGLVYGRVTTADAATLVRAHAAGRVVRHLLRGALYRTPAAQAAEAALREHLDEDRLEALTLLAQTAAPDGGQLTNWRHTPPDDSTAADSTDDATWRVTVVEEPLAPRPASCGKAPEPATGWRVVSVPSREAPGSHLTRHLADH